MVSKNKRQGTSQNESISASAFRRSTQCRMCFFFSKPVPFVDFSHMLKGWQTVAISSRLLIGLSAR